MDTITMLPYSNKPKPSSFLGRKKNMETKINPFPLIFMQESFEILADNKQLIYSNFL